jgi:Protein of unknown function (DUF4007)
MHYRFSGHESFPCRYTWLPKAVLAINAYAKLLTDDESAMVELGVGKNMVHAIRFWVQATGIAVRGKEGFSVTNFGKELLGPGGFDPYLEDVRTLWLIHWKLSTHIDEPLFAWDYLLNSWHQPEISRTEALRAFRREAKRLDRTLADITLEQHFDTFLHTYVPTRNAKNTVQEDTLDCPLVELGLIHRIGERRLDSMGRSEPVYAFRREAKPDITPGLFIYSLADFWMARHPHEETLTFRDVAFASGSPGQIFKMPEWEIRERLEKLEEDSCGVYQYHESSAFQRINHLIPLSLNTLNTVYQSDQRSELTHA